MLPAPDTVSVTKFTISSVAADGVNILSADIFSLPKPFGHTSILTLSPETILVCITAGVLSPVFTLGENVSEDLREVIRLITVTMDGMKDE